VVAIHHYFTSSGETPLAIKSRVAPLRLCVAGFGLAQAVACGFPVNADGLFNAAGLCSARNAMEGASRGKIASVNERLELTLEDGRELKLNGINPPGPTPNNADLDSKTGAKLAVWLVGREILFRPLGQRPDRWGRTPALIFASAGAAGSPFLQVAETVLDAGLARFEPSADAAHCRTDLLTAEAAARAAALGLWSDPYYAIIAATDHDSFSEKAGTFVIVEGRVTGVGKGDFRSSVFFGPRRGMDFSVTILQRHIKTFDAAGLNLNSLTGQIIRVRGLLDTRFGPQIELTSPDEIELIGPEATAPVLRPR
jgi:hypothetical protein